MFYESHYFSAVLQIKVVLPLGLEKVTGIITELFGLHERIALVRDT